MEKDNRPPAFDIAKIEERFKNIKTLSDLTGKDGIIQEMIKQTVERILKAEQEAHGPLTKAMQRDFQRITSSSRAR